MENNSNSSLFDNNIINSIKFAEIYNPEEVILNLLIAFFLGFIISLVYKKNSQRFKLFAIVCSY